MKAGACAVPRSALTLSGSSWCDLSCAKRSKHRSGRPQTPDRSDRHKRGAPTPPPSLRRLPPPPSLRRLHCSRLLLLHRVHRAMALDTKGPTARATRSHFAAENRARQGPSCSPQRANSRAACCPHSATTAAACRARTNHCRFSLRVPTPPAWSTPVL